MKRPTLKAQSGNPESSADEQLATAIADALSSNDKVVEIRPANRSTGIGLTRLALIVAGAVGLAYWMRTSQKPDELIESAKSKTARRTSDATHRAAETIQEGSETAADRIEAGSQRAGETIEDVGETAADRTESVGEAAAEESEDDDEF